MNILYKYYIKNPVLGRRENKRLKDEARKKCKKDMNDGRNPESCPWCSRNMSWCSCCQMWSSNCCIEYGTCLCS